MSAEVTVTQNPDFLTAEVLPVAAFFLSFFIKVTFANSEEVLII
jgi:hypothetical protein